SAARWQDLKRKLGWSASWGGQGRLLSPAECANLFPMVDADRIHGGLYVPDDGLADTRRACEAQGRRAIERGAWFLPWRKVTSIEREGGRVTGVRTAHLSVHPADIVICAAGFWGPRIGEM